MEHYFIGVNKRSENLIMGLMNLGATLMFRWHARTMKFNDEFGFYDGEWLFLTCLPGDQTIEKIKTFLTDECANDNSLKFEIIHQ